MAVQLTQINEIANDCAKNRYHNLCSKNCKNCPSNISLYGALSKEEAVAIQHLANLHYRAKMVERETYQRHYKQLWWRQFVANGGLGPSILLLILIAFMIFGCITVASSCSSSSVVAAVDYATVEPTATYAGRDNVTPDYYKDGMIDCKDRVIAYKLLDGANDCRIMYGAYPGGAHVWIRKKGFDMEPFTPLYWTGDFVGYNFTDVSDMTDDFMWAYRTGRKIQWSDE
jgi:hypothetical protein